MSSDIYPGDDEPDFHDLKAFKRILRASDRFERELGRPDEEGYSDQVRVLRFRAYDTRQKPLDVDFIFDRKSGAFEGLAIPVTVKNADFVVRRSAAFKQ